MNTEQQAELRREIINDFEQHIDLDLSFPTVFIEARVDYAIQLFTQELEKREREHQAIYEWLLGLNGDFPISEPGKRYNWRLELRERIAQLKDTPQ